MEINIFNQQKTLSICPKSVEKVVSCCLELANKKYEEVSIYFVEEEEICHLHDEYFDDPSPTDCISFPMDLPDDAGYLVLGDIFINPKAALDYAKEHGQDPYSELTLYVVHGLLHLLGYDDMNETDAKQMRIAEKIHLDHLRAHGVYLQHE